MTDDEAARAAAMRRLDAFAGEWTLEASFPAARFAGRAVFEWTLDRQFMVQRSAAPDSGAPDSMAPNRPAVAIRDPVLLVTTLM